jgi:hypothetical protein
MADANDIARWQQCPVCHRGDGVNGSAWEMDALTVWQNLDCANCGATWTEVYEASHREHIELVTHRENAIRGRAGETSKARAKARTHCPKGHEFDGTDNRGWQICLVCRAEASRRYEGG